MLSLDNQQEVEKLLVEQSVLNKDELEQMTTEATKEGKPLLSLLVERGVINNEDLTKLLATASGVQYVDLREAKIDNKELNRLPKNVSEQFMAVALGETDGRVAVAMLDPSNIQAVDYISQAIGEPVTVLMASQESVRHAQNQYSTDVEADVKGVIEKTIGQAEQQDAADEIGANAREVQTIVQDSPITRALKAILDYAVESGASDVHIEPMQDKLRIRVRIDGIAREIMSLPKSIEPALVSRVKILSNLKIDQHATPQDGQFHIQSKGKDVDLRVAIAPVVWGEQIVLRLLYRDDKELTLEDLGFYGRSKALIEEGIRKPYGMILSTGPTGSGKSTTLYTLINMIKDDSINVVTLEDPVERKISGVNQIQVNPGVGLTFSSGLRSILRQDPDVILVGEIRDKETATLAVQAALTGHLVFATLHTNTASGVLPRLLDMDIEPFLIASTVNTVIGQRLVRKICKDSEERKSTEAETKAINESIGYLLPEDKKKKEEMEKILGYKNLPLHSENAYTLLQGKETEECPGGYKGRVGIFEVFNMTESVEKLLTKNATSGEIQNLVTNEGMVTMRRDGYLKAVTGMTTLSEVERVAAEE